ncbi:peptidoglycan-binding domain-containing protein [Micromonospora sp. NPDC005710]|uniref:peptidoglycan-binding domain-containing protein n=1 Tax=Micromonospora sp. NPDC005710 TaxID=3157051 RepID=UPI0033D0F0FC
MLLRRILTIFALAAIAAAATTTPVLAAPAGGVGAMATSTCNKWISYNGADVPAYGSNVNCTLRRGNVNSAVFQLQVTMNVCYEWTLRSKGVYPLTGDSNFGPTTEKALKAVQAAESIPADGVYGPYTRSAIYHQRSNGGVPCLQVP